MPSGNFIFIINTLLSCKMNDVPVVIYTNTIGHILGILCQFIAPVNYIQLYDLNGFVLVQNFSIYHSISSSPIQCVKNIIGTIQVEIRRAITNIPQKLQIFGNS